MRVFNLSAVVALFALSLVLGACATHPRSYYDGHGNHIVGGELVP